MNKPRLVLAIALLATCFQLNAQNNSFSIIEKNKRSLSNRHQISDVKIEKSNTVNGDIINMKGVFVPNEAGAPDLPSHSTYIAIPEGAKAELKIIKAKTHLIKNINLIPAAEPQLDNDKNPVVHKKDMAIYNRNAFYPESPFQLSDPTSVRGVEVVSLGVMPFQYNPVTKELLVYDDVELKISVEGEGKIGDTRYRTKEWDHLLSDIILNFDDLPSIDYGQRLRDHYASEETGSEYIIITPDNADFIQLADSIRRFRIAQGVPTAIYTVNDCGGNDQTSIKNFI